MLLVTVVTVWRDLATAVVVGVIASALRYAWENSKRISARTEVASEGAKVYYINGPLFFGSASAFTELFDPECDPDRVIVDFAESRVADQSALSAIESVSAAYSKVGKSIRLRHLSHDCYRLLSRTGLLFDESDDDPDYQVATDYSVRIGLFGGAH
jgi:SulP family sulfate permease